MSHTAILMIHCPDQKGLIAKITNFLYKNQGNIIYLDQYVDTEENRFFMRVEWELNGFSIPRQSIEEAFVQELAQPLEMEYLLSFSDDRLKMAIFITKEAHCVFDLLARVKSGEFNVEVSMLVSNRADLAYVGELFHIPFHLFEINASNQAQQEQRTLALLQEEGIDLIVLARYMRILTPTLINAFQNRIINIHHSMLPAFAGAKPYHAALARGVKMIGATSHYVTEELDQGPIIEQETIHIKNNEKLPDLLRKGKDLEKIVLSRAVWLHLERKVMPYKNHTIIFKS